ncbi:hypothetical protein NHQ30_002586 [Ciborinia camelliae]|nr:hypothetical protein NHQ30_002586 [Ciborinia camelliae]
MAANNANGMMIDTLMAVINAMPLPRVNSFEADLQELERLMLGMDPDSFNEINDLLDVHTYVQTHPRYLRSVLRLARALSTKWFHAPVMPTTEMSILAPLSGGYDFYQQDDNNNKVVTVLVGSGSQQVKFTAVAGALAAQAQFFKPLYGDRWKCGREGLIELEDHLPESFEIFLAWLYTRNLKMAECLVNIHPVRQELCNGHFRKQSHKKRWFQLLHCYFMADYIGATQFANYIMDALVSAYKDWVEDEKFSKIFKDPIFESKETEELADKNTAESSPLRVMINDILSPFLALKNAEPPRHPFSIRLSSRLNHPRPSIQFPTDGIPLPGANHPITNFPNESLNLPPNHPLPNRGPWIPPAPILNPDGPHLFLPSNPRPRSRFTFGLRRRDNSEQLNSEFIKSYAPKKIWEEHRCKYHIHQKGKDCLDK